jgi:hypothetical protein
VTEPSKSAGPTSSDVSCSIVALAGVAFAVGLGDAVSCGITEVAAEGLTPTVGAALGPKLATSVAMGLGVTVGVGAAGEVVLGVALGRFVVGGSAPPALQAAIRRAVAIAAALLPQTPIMESLSCRRPWAC